MEMARLSTSPSDRSVTPSDSPTNASHGNLPKDSPVLANEIESLNKTLSTVSNQAARSFTRQNWRKCLVGGSEKEQSYLVRALLKYGTPHVYARVVQEYGERLLQAADDDFLDRVVEARLRTIGVKQLVTLLAKTSRLGYDEDDIVDDEEDVVPTQEAQEEKLVVEEPQPPVVQDAVMTGTHHSDALLEEQHRNRAAATAQALAQAAVLQGPIIQRVDLPNRRKSSKSSGKFVCPDCHAPFSQQGGLTYHIERRVCHRPPPTFKWFCRKCSKGFTTSGGKLYHEQNKVCENHEKAAATSSVGGANAPLLPQLQDGLPPAHYGPDPSTVQPPPANGSYQHPPPMNEPYQQLPPYAGPPYNQNGPHGGYLGFQNVNPRQSSEAGQNIYSRKPQSGYNTPIRSATQTSTAKSSPAPESSPSEVRVLDPATQAELNARLEAEVKRFEDKCKEIPDTLTAAEREEEINKQKRGHATRKSQIRKKYGIQVRSSKNRAANFVRISGQENSPNLEPIARIGAFRAPSVGRTTFSVTTPKFFEQDRPRSSEERPDLKRRRVESSSPDDDPHATSWSDSYDTSDRPRRTTEAGEPEYEQIQNAELNDQIKSAERALTQMDAASRKNLAIGATPKHWESLQAEQAAPSLTSADSSSRPQSSHTAFTSSRANSLVEPVVIDSSSESVSGADSDPDEEIPARLPAGRSRRKSPSPWPTDTQSPAKGVARRDSTSLPIPLSKAGTNLHAIVPV